MRVVGIPILTEFQQRHSAAEQRLEAWLTEVRAATWTTPASVKERYGSASFLSGSRVVFNVGGNAYRILAQVNYAEGIARIEKVGTHAEYTKWKLE